MGAGCPDEKLAGGCLCAEFPEGLKPAVHLLLGAQAAGVQDALGLMHMSPSPANRRTLNISDGGWMPRSWAQEGQVGQAPLGRHHQAISLEGAKTAWVQQCPQPDAHEPQPCQS